MSLKLLSDLFGKRLRYASLQTKEEKKAQGSITDPETENLLSPETLLQLFLDVAATDKSPEVRKNAWSYIGGESKIEFVDYLLEDVLKSILYDILTQFQTGLQVPLSRVVELIGSKAFDRLKELVTSLNETNVRITEEKVVTAIQELLDDQQIEGQYFEMEQVFVLGKMDKQEFKPKTFRRDFLCKKCAYTIDLDTKSCPNCQIEVMRCMICKRPISFGEETATCPKCQNQAHFAHLQEWIKAKGKCPMCSAKLKEADLTA